MIGFLSSTRAVLVVGLPLPLGGLLAAFGLGVAVTLLGAVASATRAARLSPLAARLLAHLGICRQVGDMLDEAEREAILEFYVTSLEAIVRGDRTVRYID